MIEPLEDALPIRPVWRSGEPEENARPKMVQEPFVRRRRSVVEFVDNDHVEGIRRDVCQVELRERLYRRKHMASLFGTMPVYEQLAERTISKHSPVGAEAL